MYGLMDKIDGEKNMDYGVVNGDAVACEKMCREDIKCAAWTLTTLNYPGKLDIIPLHHRQSLV